MSEPTLPGGNNPEAAHPPFGGGRMGLSGLGNKSGRSEDAITQAFLQRERERQALRTVLQSRLKMTRVERLQKSAEFSAAAVNARSKAAEEDDETARKLLAMARSFQDRVRLFAEACA